MSFPTHSTPCFTWHLPTDSLVFCAPALLLLGLTPETAPRTMADFLDRLPEPQRRFLQRQRQMALAGQGPGCLSCAYTYNGRHVREDLSIIQCDADGRPQTILGTFDVRHEGSLPAGEDGGYWTYVRKEGALLLDARCAGLLGLGAPPVPGGGVAGPFAPLAGHPPVFGTAEPAADAFPLRGAPPAADGLGPAS